MDSSTVAILIAFACYLALMILIGVACMKKKSVEHRNSLE